jgi:ribonucleoside-diphosphate reductase alpha chain
MSVTCAGTLRDGWQKRLTNRSTGLFPTPFEVSVSYQMKMQAAFQRHLENAVSKTINLAPSATADDVADAFWLAFQQG